HLGDAPAVEHHPADELHVEVPHPERALAGLAADGERLGQETVERGALVEPPAELAGHPTQLLIGLLGDLRLEAVDLVDDGPHPLDHAGVLRTEYLLGDVADHWKSGSGAEARTLTLLRGPTVCKGPRPRAPSAPGRGAPPPAAPRWRRTRRAR